METAGSPGGIFHPSLMFNREDRRKEEEIVDDSSPMSSPVDESYKIRIPRGSLSPRSHEDEVMKHDEAQDLSLGAGHNDHDSEYGKMEDESAEEISEETEDDQH